MECNTKTRKDRRRMNLATRVKEDSRRAAVAHEDLQEMADNKRTEMEEKSGSKEERRSENERRCVGLTL